VEQQYTKYVATIKMPYDLDNLPNKTSSVIFYTKEGRDLRESQSLQENAVFLVRWAEEIFGDWAPWMQHLLPTCKVSYKKSTLRIINKIYELFRAGAI